MAIHISRYICAALDALNSRKTEETSQRNETLVQEEPKLDTQERCPSSKKSHQIFGQEDIAILANDLNALLKDSSAAVVSKYKEVSKRAFSSVKILIEAPGQVVGFENQKNDARDFAQ